MWTAGLFLKYYFHTPVQPQVGMGQLHTAPSLPVGAKGLWADISTSVSEAARTVWGLSAYPIGSNLSTDRPCSVGSSQLLAVESVLLKTFQETALTRPVQDHGLSSVTDPY